MRLEHIEYFVTVARLGSVTEAADFLSKRRSTVSMAIAALEDELNVKLFERTGNRLFLSAVGESVLDDCHRLLSISRSVQQRCSMGSHPIRTEIKIGRDDALSEAFWRRIIFKLRQHFPHLSLSMRFAASDELPDLVRQQQLDIAYSMVETIHDPPEGLHRRLLGRIAMRMMIARHHPLSRLQHLSDRDLHVLPQITYMDSSNQERFHLEQVASERIALSSFELVRDAIRDGLGWGFVPEPLLQLEQRDTDELVDVAHGLKRISYPYLVYSRDILEGEKASTKDLLSEVNTLISNEIKTIAEI